LLFSTSHGLLGPLLNALGIKIIFAPPGIVIAHCLLLSHLCKGADTLDGSPGNCRGRSCADPGGKRLENLLVHYAPQYKMGAAVRRYADNCKGGRRVWCGFRCIRAYQRSYQYVPLHVEILYNEYKFLRICSGIAADPHCLDKFDCKERSPLEDTAAKQNIGTSDVVINLGDWLVMSIEIRNVSKTFDSFKALSNINLHINTGELVALLGPSGSGKTTLLRIIAGLETADEGSIIFDGEDNTKKSAQDRKVGFVFQHYALFKHMTVFENIAFGLRVMPSKIRPNKEAIKNKVYEL